MIAQWSPRNSSASIVGQQHSGGAAGGAFPDDRQLERLVEGSDIGAGRGSLARDDAAKTIPQISESTTTKQDDENCMPGGGGEQNNHATRRPNLAVGSLEAQTTRVTQMTTVGGQALVGDSQLAPCNDSSNEPLLTRITATPVRQPLGLINCDARDNYDDLAPNGCAQIAGALGPPAPAPAPPPPPSEHLANQNHFAMGNHQEEEAPEERAREQLVQRLYGDCDKVQAAAVVIQRAFRKHQICERFRMITDQLRHRPLQPRPPTPPGGEPGCQPVLEVEQEEPAIVLDRIDNEPPPPLRSQLTAPPSDGEHQNRQPMAKGAGAQVAYASGATRAAAWESLSQAASRLAASAAAARQAVSESQKAPASVASGAHKLQGQAGAQAITSTSSSSTLASTGTRSSGSTSGSSSAATAEPETAETAPLSFQQLEALRKRQYRVGLNIFNKTPEKGISFLIAHAFIDCSPPYAKSSSGASYYLSNQLHFIDKQHCLASATASAAGAGRQNCRFCCEEENLKMNVAHFLLLRKGLAKEKIGQYLGNLQCKFNQDVLVYYLQELDFAGLQVDVALRKFSSGVRMPGEAQKIERFVDRFAARYVQCQQQHYRLSHHHSQAPTVSPDNFMGTNASISHQPILLTTATTTTTTTATAKTTKATTTTPTEDPTKGSKGLPGASNGKSAHEPSNKNNNHHLTRLTRDEVFILTFAIIMLNTDLHSPSLKSTSRMSAHQFVNNLRGVFKSQTISESYLLEIYERVKAKQITPTPDHVTHVLKVQQGLTTQNFAQKQKEVPNLCVPHRRLVCFCRLFEVFDVNKKERAGQHQREIFLFNDLLLVTKLARRARANTPQQYAYRQSILLKGLRVQLFRSAHYAFGIRLFRSANEETLIMFNARNELDQSRFVDDLNESIAEMDEMESIRAHNIVESIHAKQQDRLRRHSMMHEEQPTSVALGARRDDERHQPAPQLPTSQPALNCGGKRAPENGAESGEECSFATTATTTNSGGGSGSSSANVTVIRNQTCVKAPRRMSSKFSSLSNLASLAETANECESATSEEQDREEIKIISGPGAIRPNRSFVHKSIRQQLQQKLQTSSRMLAADNQKASAGRLHGTANHLMASNGSLGARMLRSCSNNSVHSLDSGLFLSRDVSPNQSG